MTPTIQSEIELLQNTKSELKYAIMEKGVFVNPTDTFSLYPTRIGQISMTPGTNGNLMASIIDKSVTSITIPNGTTRIRQELFIECADLASVNFPNTLTEIANDAFHYCTSLTSITIPSSVTFIGYGAFASCTGLASITVEAVSPPTLQPDSSSTTTFDNTNDCPIYVPNERVNVYKQANGWSKYASRIQAIPTYKARLTLTDNSVVTIDDDGSGELFSEELYPYQSTLRELEVFSYVNTIADSACLGFTALTTVTLDNSVTTIERDAFNDCTSLTSFTAPGLTSWEENALSRSAMTYYEIPEGITNTYATFEQSPYLEEVIFPEGFLELGMNSFYQCTSLKNPVLPETLSIISAHATFYGCTGLESITFLSQYPPTVIDEAYEYYMFDNTNDCPIYVPADSVDYYKQADVWSRYADRIQAIHVPSKMIITYDNSGIIETISIPEDHICDGEEMSYPTTIKVCDIYELYEAQHPTSDIRTITIGENVEIIEYTFWGCFGLESITIEATTPPEIYDDVFVSAETNDCPIYVPSDSLQVYLDDQNWGGYYSSRLQAIPEPQPVDPYPELESVQIFKMKENLNDVTSGKYIIQSSGYILNASLIETTTGTGNGINNYSSGNTISFADYRMGQGICQVNANTLNAAMDYDATNHTLSWTNTNNNTTYYLSQRTTTSSNFKYSGTTTVPTTTITVAQVNSNRNITFKQNYALGYGSSAISWYNASNSSAFTGIYLYKLETVSAAPVATFTLSDTSEVKVYDYSGNNANLTFDLDNSAPYYSTVVEASIKRNVEEIGHGAFDNFQYLETVTIPDSVDTIGDYAFRDCSNLTSLTVKATYPPTLGSDVFTNTNSNLVIYVPAESVNDYKAASGWSDYASKIQAIS